MFIRPLPIPKEPPNAAPSEHLFQVASVKHLFEAARIAAMDSQAKIKYIHMIDRERDLRNQFQFATDKGIAEGIEIGREEERKLMASKLKAMGVGIDVIIEPSGLTREEIEKL